MTTPAGVAVGVAVGVADGDAVADGVAVGVGVAPPWSSNAPMSTVVSMIRGKPAPRLSVVRGCPAYECEGVISRVDGRTARQQRPGLRKAAIIGQRAKHRIDRGPDRSDLIIRAREADGRTHDPDQVITLRCKGAPNIRRKPVGIGIERNDRVSDDRRSCSSGSEDPAAVVECHIIRERRVCDREPERAVINKAAAIGVFALLLENVEFVILTAPLPSIAPPPTAPPFELFPENSQFAMFSVLVEKFCPPPPDELAILPVMAMSFIVVVPALLVLNPPPFVPLLAVMITLFSVRVPPLFRIAPPRPVLIARAIAGRKPDPVDRRDGARAVLNDAAQAAAANGQQIWTPSVNDGQPAVIGDHDLRSAERDRLRRSENNRSKSTTSLVAAALALPTAPRKLQSFGAAAMHALAAPLSSVRSTVNPPGPMVPAVAITVTCADESCALAMSSNATASTA